MGFWEIWITPSNGMSSSRIKKIAPDTDSAARQNHLDVEYNEAGSASAEVIAL